MDALQIKLKNMYIMHRTKIFLRNYGTNESKVDILLSCKDDRGFSILLEVILIMLTRFTNKVSVITGMIYAIIYGINRLKIVCE